VLLFTIGAAKNHENIAEKETEVTTITNIFGMELEDLLLCKVVGDSMENAHIFEGDTLIIDTKTNPKDSDIIVININNQTVVKKLKLTGSEMMLIPENEKFDPHLISENDNYTIIGKVKHILHSL
jgi:SOS-response transcriptional repressor LexA